MASHDFHPPSLIDEPAENTLNLGTYGLSSVDDTNNSDALRDHRLLDALDEDLLRFIHLSRVR